MNVHFQANVPQTLALTDPQSEQFGEYEITYTLTDGRFLKVSRTVAAKINELDLQPGETFGICKQMVFNEQRRRNTPEWSVWLTPESEKARAKQEMKPPMTLADVKRPKVRSIRKTAALPSQQTALTFDRSTGTYGAIPFAAIAQTAATPLQCGLQRSAGLRYGRIEASRRATVPADRQKCGQAARFLIQTKVEDVPAGTLPLKRQQARKIIKALLEAGDSSATASSTGKPAELKKAERQTDRAITKAYRFMTGEEPPEGEDLVYFIYGEPK